MTGEEWVLAVTIFFSGLASGLLGMLCTIMRPMLTEMDGPDFRLFMGPSFDSQASLWESCTTSLGRS